MNEEPDFTDFLAPEKWRSFEDHCMIVGAELDRDVVQLARENAKIRAEARTLLQEDPNFTIVQTSPADLAWAEEQLFAGAVCAIDGTHAIYPMLSGVRCQIGVAATCYTNKRTDGVVFISEQQISAQDTNVLGILERRKKTGTVISRLVVRAIMFYMEREKALERHEAWILFNGPLVPYELRTGLGRFQAIDPCLSVCEKVLDRETVVGVIADTQDEELISLGLALNPGEYVRIRSYAEDLELYLETSGLRGNQRRRMQEFNERYARQIEVGLYRAGRRAYIFHAHVDHFCEAAKIVMRDSMFQPLRSYPLLIDYADALCAKLLPASQFTRMIDFKLAKLGCLEFEQEERGLRRR
jgi:hypothetical protein